MDKNSILLYLSDYEPVKDFSLEEKEKIIIEKRKEILQLISDKPCTCKDYLKNSDIHIRKIDL